MAIFMDGIGWVDNTPDADQHSVEVDMYEMNARLDTEDDAGFKIAWDREESDPCEKGTPGCCVLNHREHDNCECW